MLHLFMFRIWRPNFLYRLCFFSFFCVCVASRFTEFAQLVLIRFSGVRLLPFAAPAATLLSVYIYLCVNVNILIMPQNHTNKYINKDEHGQHHQRQQQSNKSMTKKLKKAHMKGFSELVIKKSKIRPANADPISYQCIHANIHTYTYEEKTKKNNPSSSFKLPSKCMRIRLMKVFQIYTDTLTYKII